MFLDLIASLLKESGTFDAVEAYLVSLLAAVQTKPPDQRLPSGDRAKDVATVLKSHFMQSEHLSLMQRRMLGAGWVPGLSAPRTGKEFWAFCPEGVLKARWSSSVKRFVAVGEPDHRQLEPILWLPLSALPASWAPAEPNGKAAALPSKRQ